MAICARCISAIQRLDPLAWQSGRKNEDVNIELPLSCRSAVCGCWICFKLSRWLEAENPRPFEEWRKQPLQVNFNIFASLHLEKPQEDLLWPWGVEISAVGYEIEGASCEIELNFMSAAEFSVYKSTAPKHHTTAGVDLDLVDRWVGTCKRDHTRCRETSESWYPTRLLSLGSQEREVKLIISRNSPPSGPYMTLSYRWGSHPFAKLTTTNLIQLQHAIDVPSLPQVFRDTIKIAYHLGIKYLWIDGLCIIQGGDNFADWEKESQTMDQVYSGAFLNVSATMSFDGSEALFRDRSWGLFLHSEIKLEVNGVFQKYYVLDGDMWSDEIINAPLNRRGWVFQEHFLARRVLNFGEHQMGWECRELDALEMFPEGLPQASVQSSMGKSGIASMMATLNQQSEQPPDLKFVDLWQKLVTDYSKCELTYSKDKLVAFAGVSKSLMEARTDQYAAGMWGRGAIYDLAWWRSSEDREAFPISKTSGRAPSWSWASVDGEINFRSTFGGVRNGFIEVLEMTERTSNEDCAITRPESIRIQGHCLPLEIKCSGEGIIGFSVAGFRFTAKHGVRDSNLDLEIRDEELLEWVQRSKAVFLPLFATATDLHGIILAKVRGVCAHRRLGAVEIPIKTTGLGKEFDEEDEEDDENPRIGPSRLRAWWMEASTFQSHPSNTFWSTSALGLVEYLLEPSRLPRVISIY